MVGFISRIRPDAEVHQFDPSIAGKPRADFDWAGYKLIVMDSRLGRENGLEWFKDYSATIDDFPPVVFLSSQNDVDIAVEAMKLGARDFLLKKGIKQSRLKRAIQNILPEAEPLPNHHDTLDYAAADTQVLAESARDKVAAAQTVEEIDEDTNSYWEEQTQILHAPPK
jgi:FixJ family two-component response regulator